MVNSDQKYVQSKSEHFASFAEAEIYKNLLNKEIKAKIRRRREGFDVVTYKELVKKPAKTEKIKEELPVKQEMSKFKKNKQKKQQNKQKKEKRLFNPIKID